MALRYWRCSVLRLCVSVFEWKKNKRPALHACNEFLHLTHLSGGGKRGSVLQQHGSNILVSFAGSQVKGGVAWGGGSVGRGAALQQLLDDVDFPQPTGDVQRCLVILRRRKEEKVTLLAQYLYRCLFFVPGSVIDNEPRVLTLDLVSTLAPFLSRYRTTSAWPALAAMWRAVSPLWKTQKKEKVISGSVSNATMRDLNS